MELRIPAIVLVLLFVSNQSGTVADMAIEMDLPEATVNRALRELKDRGYVQEYAPDPVNWSPSIRPAGRPKPRDIKASLALRYTATSQGHIIAGRLLARLYTTGMGD